MISSLISRIVILLFGTLYPAYASYKAVRTKDVKEYVKWMMYWIVFALFISVETITDVFFSFWFPFYYELKIIVVLWLLSPATQGSSILYRKCVHPLLSSREQEIDECLARAKRQSYRTVLELGTKGVHYATQVIMQTAIKGGGGLVSQLKKSYSVGDLPSGGRSQNGRALTRPASVPEDDVVDNTTWVAGRPLPTLPDISDSELDEHGDPLIGTVLDPVMYVSMPPPNMRPPRVAKSPKGVYFGEIDGHPRRLESEDMAFLGVRSSEDMNFSSNEQLTHVDSPTRLMRTGSLRAPRPQSQIITRSTGIPMKGVSNTNLQDQNPADKTRKESHKRVKVAPASVKKRRAPLPPSFVVPKSFSRHSSNLVSSTLTSALPVLCLGQWDGLPWSGSVVCNVTSAPQSHQNDQETHVTNSGCEVEAGHSKLSVDPSAYYACDGLS